MTVNLVDKVNSILPQTQCEECGYAGCRPYAEAMVSGEEIDLCAPGGQKVYQDLVNVLGRVGSSTKVDQRYKKPMLAEIDQQACIGCVKCIRVCPTQAILGMKKRNHFVIASDCTGCGLCLPVCPVDCIDLVEDILSVDACLSLAEDYKELYEQKQARDKNTEKRLPNRLQHDLLADLKGIRGRKGDE